MRSTALFIQHQLLWKSGDKIVQQSSSCVPTRRTCVLRQRKCTCASLPNIELEKQRREEECKQQKDVNLDNPSKNASSGQDSNSLPAPTVPSNVVRVLQKTITHLSIGCVFFGIFLGLFDVSLVNSNPGILLRAPSVHAQGTVVEAIPEKTAWTPSQVPNPQRDSKGLCGRNGAKSAICDPNGFVSLNMRKSIDRLINSIAEGENGYRTVPCGDNPRGYQLGVAIINRMDESYYKNSYLAERAKSFAKEIHNRWGVGNRERNNGVVLFISGEDRQIYVSTGKGARKALSDSDVRIVLRNMKPHLREGRYDDAVFLGVQEMGRILNGQVSRSASPEEDEMTFNFVAGLITLSLVGQVFNEFRHRSRFEKCKSALLRLDKDTEDVQHGRFESSSCPICLEELGEIQTVSSVHVPVGSCQIETLTILKKWMKRGDSRVILPCGHQFHADCQSDWKSTKQGRGWDECPICGTSFSGNLNVQNRIPIFDEERRFRIQRVREMYPAYVPSSVLDGWQADPDISLEEQIELINKPLLTSSGDEGEDGSSFTFGGGDCGDGGGGGGDGW